MMLGGQSGGYQGQNVRERRENPHKKKRKHIQNFCTDLTGRARRGELDNIVGREKEIQRAIQILSRRTKNNPCLIGEHGVGKTAVAEHCAGRCARQAAGKGDSAAGPDRFGGRHAVPGPV